MSNDNPATLPSRDRDCIDSPALFAIIDCSSHYLTNRVFRSKDDARAWLREAQSANAATNACIVEVITGTKRDT